MNFSLANFALLLLGFALVTYELRRVATRAGQLVRLRSRPAAAPALKRNRAAH